MILPKSLKVLAVLLSLVSSLVCAETPKPEIKWRALKLENTALMTLPTGKVVIELAPQFSPKHVEQFKTLIKQGYYNNSTFYRVINGFVAQGGPSEEQEKKHKVPLLSLEGEWSITNSWPYTQIQSPDMFAPITGYKQGFAIGVSTLENKAWLTHCPGIIAMARENQPDTASGHFYITIGQAPRYLDRIMSIFGRVVYGMDNVQALKRTQVIEGATKVSTQAYDKIIAIELMSNVAKKDRIMIEVEDTESPHFIDYVKNRRSYTADFFYRKPAPIIDVCQTKVKSRMMSNEK